MNVELAWNPDDGDTDLSPMRWPTIAALLLVLSMMLFAHGCHGPDADHELFARRIWMK